MRPKESAVDSTLNPVQNDPSLLSRNSHSSNVFVQNPLDVASKERSSDGVGEGIYKRAGLD